MHYIQKHILDELRKTDDSHYAKLNPDRIESGHFRYHLTQLIKDGYIMQKSRGVYSLTDTGKSRVDKLSMDTVKAKAMPKVITYTLLRDKESVVLYRKQKQPYLNLLNMIGGKLHEGELSSKASIREVKEKTGVVIPEPELLGVFEVIIKDTQSILTHTVAYVYEATVNSKDYSGDSFAIIDKSNLKSREDLAPDFLPILDKIYNRSTSVISTIEVFI